MNLEEIEKLCDEAMEDYNSGWEKTYKHVPELVWTVRELLAVAKAVKEVRFEEAIALVQELEKEE